MGKKVSFVKGLAMGAALAAAAHMLMNVADKDKKAKAVKKAAHDVKNRVIAHAKRLGKMTKVAYGKIVDTTVGEYRGVKALSDEEMDELKEELKASWKNVEKMIKK